jgi:hypothetical protein
VGAEGLRLAGEFEAEIRHSGFDFVGSLGLSAEVE